MNQTRKEAIRKYKEQKTPRGIFAVRCTATGRVWIGASRNLNAEKNSSWFGLRTSAHVNREMQAEWNEHGELAFVFELLETLDDDVHELALRDVLKVKQADWMERLRALKA